MRLALVFPAQANPTYVPLGIAALAAHARRLTAVEAARCFDFNLPAWERSARAVAGGEEAVGFFKGLIPGFFDEDAYRSQLAVFRKIIDAVGAMAAAARRYVETDWLDQALAEVLDGQIRELEGFDPTLVGVSVLYPAQLAWALALAKRMRALGAMRGARLVLGGATMAHIRFDQLLGACDYIDAVAVGEGEPIIEQMAGGAAFESIPGLACKTGGGASFSLAKEPARFAGSPAPDFSDFDLGRYFSAAPVLPVLYSRGCRWRRCRFCAHNFSYGDYRAKGAAEFVDELAAHQRELGASHFYFADQYIDAKSLMAVADEIIGRGLDIRFHVMARPTRNYNSYVLSRLRRAGCVWLSWGMETGSQRLLDIAGKGTNAERAMKVFAAAKQADISNLLMMIFGLPMSSDADLQETFEFIERVYDDVDAFTSSAFVLWDRTAFARLADKYGLKIEGPEAALTIGGREIQWRRLKFKELGGDGSARPARGPMEIARWKERRRWLGEASIFESLMAEHYLLWASHRRGRLPDSHPAPSTDLNRDHG